MRTVVAFLLTAVGAMAVPVEKITDFKLSDQGGNSRTYHFPKARASVITVADKKGSEQLSPWIESLYARYAKRIDIDGIADVSMIPKPLQGIFRIAFKKQLSYSVMLDWGGSVVKQFGYEKGVANVYVLDRSGFIVKHFTGPASSDAMDALNRELDRVIAAAPPNP